MQSLAGTQGSFWDRGHMCRPPKGAAGARNSNNTTCRTSYCLLLWKVCANRSILGTTETIAAPIVVQEWLVGSRLLCCMPWLRVAGPSDLIGRKVGPHWIFCPYNVDRRHRNVSLSLPHRSRSFAFRMLSLNLSCDKALSQSSFVT